MKNFESFQTRKSQNYSISQKHYFQFCNRKLIFCAWKFQNIKWKLFFGFLHILKVKRENRIKKREKNFSYDTIARNSVDNAFLPNVKTQIYSEFRIEIFQKKRMHSGCCLFLRILKEN
jgi:hypothetical protein